MGYIAWVGSVAFVVALAGCGATTFEPNQGATGGAQPTSTGGRGGIAGAGSGSNSAGASTTIDQEPNALGTGALGACNADGWCWQNPTPVGDLFYAISDDGRYAAGESGVVFHWPDHYLPSAGVDAFSFVQASGDTVWAGGFGLWRFDGAAWSRESEGTVAALSLAPSGEPWVLMDGAVQHLRGGEWVREEPAGLAERDLRLCDLIVVDETTVWALATNFVQLKATPDGGQLTLFEFHAGVWSELASNVKDVNGRFRFLRVDSKVYVQVVGFQGYQGVYSPADDWSLVAPKNVSDPPWDRVFASPTGGFLAQGEEGLLMVSDGGGEKVASAYCWQLVPTSNEAALCANVSGGLSLIRPGIMAEAEPTQALPEARFGHVPTTIWARAYAAWGSGPRDVWRNQLEHFDGASWSSHSDAVPDDFYVEQIDGSAPDNVWFRSLQTVVHYDGKAFQLVPLPEAGSVFVSAIRTLAADDTWIVRGDPNGAKVLHFDGAEWHETLDLIGETYAYARAGFAGGGLAPLWVALGSGLYRWQDDDWHAVLSRSDGYSLVDVAADGGDVWVLGQDAVYRLEGSELVPRGRHSGALENIALTDHQVWHYRGSRARTLAR